MTWLCELRRQLEEEQVLTPEVVTEVIRRNWGGERLYIPHRRQEPPQVLPTDTPKSLQRRYGISRSTAYGWISRWRR